MSGFGFRVPDFVCQVPTSGFGVSGFSFGFRGSGFGYEEGFGYGEGFGDEEGFEYQEGFGHEEIFGYEKGFGYHEVEEGEVVLEAQAEQHPAREHRVRP